MAISLLLALLLPLLQDDPQVTYREGLFEEVDQGNLEKAAELYAKILKSGAPDALKAKALLRTGFCHEKKGRTKEAEQAWRDLIERYPKAAETVKIARERLVQKEGAAPSVSPDEKVRSLILDLGASSEATQVQARRTLLLLGNEAVPQLQDALKHHDRVLSNNAARVLAGMGRYEGVYDSIRRFWLPKDGVSHDETMTLGILLPAHESYRKAFLKDVQVIKETTPTEELAPILMRLGDPELAKVVEDWIVTSGELYDGVMEVWLDKRPVAEVLGLMKRLAAERPPEGARLRYLFRNHEETSKNEEARKLVLSVLADAGNAREAGTLTSLVPSIEVRELIRGPFARWFAQASAQDRASLMYLGREQRNDEERKLYAEVRKFLFDQLASKEVSLDIKELIVTHVGGPENSEENSKYMGYALEYWKANRERTKAGRTKEMPDPLVNAVRALVSGLQTDSKDLPDVLDSSFDFAVVPVSQDAKRRALEVDAALRALSRSASQRWAHMWLSKYGTTEDKIRLAGTLPGLGDGEMAVDSATLYINAVRSLDDAAFEAQWKDLKARVDAAGPRVKHRLINGLVGKAHTRVDELMAGMASSELDYLRWSAIEHWGQRNVPESQAHLAAALKDPSPHSKLKVIGHMRNKPSIDYVPSLIPLLESQDAEIVGAVTATLEQIKKHVEAKAEWKRWYDETKKALEK